MRRAQESSQEAHARKALAPPPPRPWPWPAARARRRQPQSVASRPPLAEPRHSALTARASRTPPVGAWRVRRGEARWSRTQLLGELARGSWGMARAEASDLFGDGPRARAGGWKQLVRSDRLIYAPQTAMTEERARGGGGIGGADSILSSDSEAEFL